MANNNFGTVSLEVYRKGESNFAVIGTEGIYYVDARFSRARAIEELSTFARWFVERNPQFEWRGDVYLLGGRGKTVNLFEK